MHAHFLFRRGLLVLGLLSVSSPVTAHAILMDGYPAPNGTVPAGTVAIRLRFNSRIDIARSRLTLVVPGRDDQGLQIRPGPTPDLMEADTIMAAGEMQLHWQVLAIDGHITRGVIAFTGIAR